MAPSETTSTVFPSAVAAVCLCHHVRRAGRAVTRLFDEALAPSGINSSQFNILIEIAAQTPATAVGVAGRLAMDRTTLSRNLKPLRRAGYVSAAGGAGRRPDQLALTTSGNAVLTKATSLWQQAQGRLSRHLGSAQAGTLLQLLGTAAELPAL
jgi:DNA-binding MarR family transcriptional regulator